MPDTVIFLAVLSAFVVGIAVTLWFADRHHSCPHVFDWYADAETRYTGYLERCRYCGEIRQVPQ